jgi:hypothetical protein
MAITAFAGGSAFFTASRMEARPRRDSRRTTLSRERRLARDPPAIRSTGVPAHARKR